MGIKAVKDLKAGDVVLTHGMRVKLFEDAKLSTVHADGETYWAKGRVLNRAEVSRLAVPYSYTDRGDEGHVWSIQSNHLRDWMVED